jgi:hypothetical protein
LSRHLVLGDAGHSDLDVSQVSASVDDTGYLNAINELAEEYDIPTERE